MVKNYGLTNKEVLASISESNLMIPAGALANRKGSFNVTIPSLIENREDLLKLPIKSNNNSVVFLKDVAEVGTHLNKDATEDNGENAVILEVSKRTGENIIDL